MMRRLLNRYKRLDRHSRHVVAAAVFLALLFQPMIPAGFMPAADGSLALQICHSGIDDLGSGAKHSGGHSHVGFCAFGALPGVGPVYAPASVPACQAATALRQAGADAPQILSPIERAQSARGPPIPA
jgi:hypothetical protein